jgi:hypothetical protein
MPDSTTTPKLQFRLVWLFLIVAIVAINCGAMRAILDRRIPFMLFAGIICLPTANILTLGLLLGIRYPRTRRFLIGFEISGAMSLFGIMFGLLSRNPPTLLELLVVAWVRPSFDRWPDIAPNMGSLLRLFGECAYLSAPQLAIATLGGLFTARVLPDPPPRARGRRVARGSVHNT